MLLNDQYIYADVLLLSPVNESLILNVKVRISCVTLLYFRRSIYVCVGILKIYESNVCGFKHMEMLVLSFRIAF